MIIYLTRHGQVHPTEFYETVDFPRGDMPLTSLGRRQASLLGKRVNNLGFKGIVYSSPYRRTIDTAEIIAEKTGNMVIPTPYLREIVRTDEAAASFTGMTFEEIQERYELIHRDAKLAYPWWTDKKYDMPIILDKTKEFLDTVIGKGEDVFFVGHGATVYGLISNIIAVFDLDILPHDIDFSELLANRNYNCTMSRIEIRDGKLISMVLFDTEHLADDEITSNAAERERPEKIAYKL